MLEPSTKASVSAIRFMTFPPASARRHFRVTSVLCSDLIGKALTQSLCQFVRRAQTGPKWPPDPCLHSKAAQEPRYRNDVSRYRLSPYAAAATLRSAPLTARKIEPGTVSRRRPNLR